MENVLREDHDRPDVLVQVFSCACYDLLSFGAAVVYVLMTIGIATVWRFPVPFGLILLVVPYVAIMSILTILVIGPRVITTSPVLFSQLTSLALVVSTQGTVAMVYPLFTAVFYLLSGIQQTAFVFAIPLIKFAAKAIIAKAAKGLHCYVGMLVVFSVDDFNDFYVAICVQISKSTLTTVTMISLDFLHVMVGVHAIFRHPNTARRRRPSKNGVVEPTTNCFEELSGMMNKLYLQQRISKSPSSRFCLFAPFPLPLSDERAAVLKKIASTSEKIDAYPSPKSTASARLTKFVSNIRLASRLGSRNRFIKTSHGPKLHQVVPVTMLTQHSASPQNNGGKRRKVSTPERLLTLMDSDTAVSADRLRALLSYKATETAMWDVLQALFHAEYLLIAEYIECALPMYYAIYLLVLFQLRVSQYYPPTAVSFRKLQGSVTNILIFTVVEFLGFLGLLVLLRRKFGISPLYQLAFVLETHARTVQGHLLLWTIFILRMPLVHYGNEDFHEWSSENSFLEGRQEVETNADGDVEQRWFQTSFTALTA